MRRGLPLLLAATALVLWAPARAGKLDQVRDTVHGDEPEPTEDEESGEADTYDSGDDSSDDVSVLAELALWLLDVALEAEAEEVSPGTLARRDPNRSDLQLSSEYAYDLDGVHRPGLTARWFPTAHVGIDASVLHYLEIEQRALDQLLLGDANLLFRWWPDPAVAVHIGGGVAWLYDRPQVEVGFNLSAGTDALLLPRLVLSTRADLGGIGHAVQLHGRATLGYKLSAAELYLGYDARGFYGEGGGVLFHGPVAGLRGWF